jgi:hypothetical protein
VISFLFVVSVLIFVSVLSLFRGGGTALSEGTWRDSRGAV